MALLTMSRLQGIEAILFDLDGTLIDTDDMAVNRLAKRLAWLLGRKARPVARRLVMKAETPGNALVIMLDMLGLDQKLMGLTDRLRRLRGVYPAGEFHLIPGVEEMVAHLQPHYQIGLVTTRSRYHIDHFLAQFPTIANLVQASCGLQDTYRLKPHPAPVRLAAKRLNVPVERCVMVGDTTVDVLSGRRAGAWSVAVLCGFGERPELERAGAHFVLPSTANLLEILDK